MRHIQKETFESAITEDILTRIYGWEVDVVVLICKEGPKK